MLLKTRKHMFLKVRKQEARKRYNDGQEVLIAGDNINEFHLLEGWHLACRISIWQDVYSADFDWRIERFEALNTGNGLGKRAAYYVEVAGPINQTA